MITLFDLFISVMLVICDKLAIASHFLMMLGSDWYLPLLCSVLFRITLKVSLENSKNVACIKWRFPLLEQYFLGDLLPLFRPERLLQISLCFLKMHSLKSLASK